jgi:hypothetical protein
VISGSRFFPEVDDLKRFCRPLLEIHARNPFHCDSGGRQKAGSVFILAESTHLYDEKSRLAQTAFELDGGGGGGGGGGSTRGLSCLER